VQITYSAAVGDDDALLSKGISKIKNTHQRFSLMGVLFLKMPWIFSVFNPYYLPGITGKKNKKKQDLMCRVKPQGCRVFKHDLNLLPFKGLICWCCKG
jgi:hypothetical protein